MDKKYIDAEKLIAEIERRIDSWKLRGEHSPEGQGKDTCVSRVTELTDLLSFITSLQQEQPEVDLVTEYDEQFDSDPVYGKLANRNAGIAIARHFYELGLNARKQQPECGCSEKPNNLSSEWTEEDERTRWDLCSLLMNLQVGKKIEESTFKKYYSWLKIIHIKPRKTRKSEQSEVDLEKAFESYLNNMIGQPRMWHPNEQIEWGKSIAHHFAEWGAIHLNARKEE